MSKNMLAAAGGLAGALPEFSRLQVLDLNELRADGRVHLIAERLNDRWYIGPQPEGE